MAKTKTSKTKTKSKGKSGSGARTGDRLENARKIGERQETITHMLSPTEVELEQREVCKLLREIEKTEGEIKNVTATHKSRLVDLKTRLRSSANIANTAKRDIEITVEEWLSDKNEVIRVRTDTGEVIGNRTARAAELQEDLPLDSEEGDDEAEEGDDEDDDGGEDAAEAGDFGSGAA
jgi:hypothetical protein